MIRRLIVLTALFTLALASTASAAPAQRAFALSGTNLLSFNPATPTLTRTTAITGVDVDETLVGIDVRPQNGFLYGLGVNATTDTATLYVIGPDTGFAGIVGAASGSIAFVDGVPATVDFPDPAMVGYGFDFNPAADRVRVVAGSLNFRVNPNTGAAVDGNVIAGTNPDGSTNSGTTSVDAAAYTNNVPNIAFTTLYTLDGTSNSLYNQNAPNNGTQTSAVPLTLGGSPLDFTTATGFDIATGVNVAANNNPVVSGSASAILNVGGSTGFYSINLVTGVTTLVGAVGNGATAVQGLALQRDADEGYPVVALRTAENLLRFNSTTPGTVTTVSTDSPAVGETFAAISWRPQTGQLYAFAVNATTNTGTLYIVDPQGGNLTAVGATGQITYLENDGVTAVDLPDPATNAYGLDFNPTVDRVRLTTSTGINGRINPNTGAPVDADGVATGTQADGDLSATGVASVAYTNAAAQSLIGGVTTEYALDATLDRLVIVNPPNNGTLTTPVAITLGGAPLNFTQISGFDISADVTVNTSNTAVTSGSALAALTVGGSTGLYRIDLVTGVATALGNINAGMTVVQALAVGNAQRDLPTVSIADTSVVEGNTGTASLTFTVSLSSPASYTTTVDVATADGSATDAGNDYEADTAMLTFARGEVEKTFTVDINGDTAVEADETVTAALTLPTPAGFLTVADASATGTITSDDAVTVSVSDATAVAEGNSGTTSQAFTVSLSAAPATTVGVQVATADGTATDVGNDYEATTQTFSFAPGETSKTFNVSVNGDTAFESNEAYGVALSLPTGLVTIADGSGTADITNDDTAAVPPVVVVPPVTDTDGDALIDTMDCAPLDTKKPAQGVGVVDANCNGINDSAEPKVATGTKGSDSITGGTAADKLSGGTGNDTLDGGAGNDLLRGGSGNDRIFGGLGNDRLFGDTGNDVLRGGAGNDRLTGGAGNDRLYGDAGNDVLIGGTGVDLLSGGSGNDVINSKDSSRDVVTCGAGKDRVIADRKDKVAADCERVTRH